MGRLARAATRSNRRRSRPVSIDKTRLTISPHPAGSVVARWPPAFVAIWALRGPPCRYYMRPDALVPLTCGGRARPRQLPGGRPGAPDSPRDPGLATGDSGLAAGHPELAGRTGSAAARPGHRHHAAAVS